MIIIGEKINGAIPSVAKAIEEKNEDWIRDLAKRQSDAGADYIDVCSSVMDKDVETLKWLIDLVQEVCDTRICIDSPSAKSIVEAIPFCSKPGIINSVSLEGDKIETVFPVISGTDWECIALLSGKSRISESVDERIEIFEQIMEKAKEYQIKPEKLHIDPLVFSVGTNPESFSGYAQVSRHIKEKYPQVHITSGLSNISFGIPSRKTMNQAFLILAMQAGMDCAIIDPTNRDMIGSIFATEALLEMDEYCIEYIGAYNEGRFGVKKS
ncbi:MAG: methyltetrahydrofolate cobalamin methyltransferase [Parasporobacterium sp.]|nr:methyltetrahydrofolate cobalamin methyltransferase [Parasporobacterium sp.]